MAIIDDYLRAVLGKNGEELFLSSGKGPVARTGGAPTQLSNTPLSVEQIESMIAEVVPAKRMQGAQFRFQYSGALGAFIGLGQRGEGSIQVIVRKSSAGEPSFGASAAPAPAPAPSPAPAPRPAPAPVAAASPAPVAAPEPDASDGDFSALPLEAVAAPAPVAPVRAAPPPPAPVMVQAAPPPQPVFTPPMPAPQAAPRSGPRVMPVFSASAVITGTPPAINKLFEKMVRMKSSDLHLSSTVQPMVRIDGSMTAIKDEPALPPEKLYELLVPIMPERNLDEFEKTHDTDFAYEITGLGRFRCNVFMDRKGPGAVFRLIPTKILTADDLKLPDVVRMFANLSKGLVLVTGPTGSGKSTTLAAVVDLVNQTRDDHLITIEDPIEFVHPNKKCLVNQRELHTHTDSFKDALRAALREDPDIVLVGEMRDLETIEIAMETAETGHLVFGTLHTTTAASTVNRIIEQFPADRQAQIRVMLSESLRGVVSQTLCKRIGGGRVAVLEVLIVTSAVSNLIREGKTFQIPSVQQMAKNEGMSLQHEVLAEMVKKGIIEGKEAYIKAVDKKGFIGALENMKYNVQALLASVANLVDL
jgi:twitching motility protein PilT